MFVHNNTVTATPVSYTHLDVYKRQVLLKFLYSLSSFTIKLGLLFAMVMFYHEL